MSQVGKPMSVRTLVLLRHAKAEHTPGVADAQRRLTGRGHEDAQAAGAWLAGQRLIPDLVVSSPSRRTRETWHAVATALGADAAHVSAEYEPRLYTASDGEDLLDVVRELDDGCSVAVLIGHNPTLSALSALLDPGGPADGLRTGGLAVHRVEGPWHECAPGGAPLTATHTARA
jgi:phosphohistidine phosphatase